MTLPSCYNSEAWNLLLEKLLPLRLTDSFRRQIGTGIPQYANVSFHLQVDSRSNLLIRKPSAVLQQALLWVKLLQLETSGNAQAFFWKRNVEMATVFKKSIYSHNRGKLLTKSRLRGHDLWEASLCTICKRITQISLQCHQTIPTVTNHACVCVCVKVVGSRAKFLKHVQVIKWLIMKNAGSVQMVKMAAVFVQKFFTPGPLGLYFVSIIFYHFTINVHYCFKNPNFIAPLHSFPFLL